MDGLIGKQQVEDLLGEMESKTGQPGGQNDNTVINRIMMKFRPIAPKPLPEGSDTAEQVPYKRTKRKYVRVKKSSSFKSNNDEAKGDLVMFDGALDESPTSESDGKGSSAMWSFTPEQPTPMNYPNFISADGSHGINPSRKVVESWLVVDGITETFHRHSMDIGVLGISDTELMRSLEMDTCPVLISDGEHRVQYMNIAYKNMVVEGGCQVEEEGDPPVEMAVWLVLNERIPDTWTVFTCRVRVVYTWREEKHSLIVPCDVWRMDFGGFAWRLDPKAALKLGR